MIRFNTIQFYLLEAAATPVSQNHGGAHEARGYVTKSNSGGHEAKGYVTQSRSGVHAGKSYVTQSRSGGHEATGYAEKPHSGAHEALGDVPVSADHGGAHEARAPISASHGGALEAIAPVATSHECAHEATDAITPASAVGAHECIGVASYSNVGAHEGYSDATSVMADHVGAHEGQYVGFFNRRAYTLIDSKLDGLAEKSALCYDHDEDYLYTVTNNAHIIRRFDRKGTQVGSDITFPVGNDLEGIEYLGDTTAYPGRFVIMEEGEGTTPYDRVRFYFFDMDGSTTSISSGDVTTIDCTDIEVFPAGGKGCEGVAYDRVRDKFYNVIQSMADGEGGLWETTISGGVATSTRLFRWYDTIVAAGYLSGTGSVSDVAINPEMRGYEDSIFVLAWSSSGVETGQAYVFEMDRSGNILSVFDAGGIGQIEGLAFDRLTEDFYLTGEEATTHNVRRYAFRTVTPPSQDVPINLEQTGWRYWYPTSDTPGHASDIDYFSTSPKFYEAGFDPDAPPDSHPAWNTGQQMIGYGALDWSGGTRTVRTNVTDLGSNLHTLYEIFDFEVTDASEVASAQIEFYRDDGVSVWLNGTKIAASNEPTVVAHNANASGAAVGGTDEGAVQAPVSISPSLFVTGTNRIAVAVWNNGGTSSDLGADFILTLDLGVSEEPVGKRHDGALEAVVAVGNIHAGAHEALGTGATAISTDHVGGHEALGAPSSSSSGAHEALGAPSASIAGAQEAVEALAGGLAGAHEAVQGLSGTLTGAHEALGAPSASLAGAHEALEGLSAGLAGAHEAVQGLSASLTGAHEAFSADGVSASLEGAHEALGAPSASLAGAQEAVEALAAGLAGAHEGVQGLSGTLAGAHEALGVASAALTGGHEGFSADTVSASLTGAHEALGVASAALTGGHEGFSADAVSASLTGAHEALGAPSASLAGAHEALGAPSFSSSGAHEALAQVVVSLGGGHEALIGLSSAWAGGQEALGVASAALTGGHGAEAPLLLGFAGAHESLAPVELSASGGQEALGYVVLLATGGHHAKNDNERIYAVLEEGVIVLVEVADTPEVMAEQEDAPRVNHQIDASLTLAVE